MSESADYMYYRMTKSQKLQTLGEIANAGGVLQWVTEKNYQVDSHGRHLLGFQFANELTEITRAINLINEMPELKSQEEYERKLEIDKYIYHLYRRRWRINDSVCNQWEKIRSEERVQEEDEESKRKKKIQIKEDAINEMVDSLTPHLIMFLISND